MAKAHLTVSQLAHRKLHIAEFKGFNYKTTESQALRLFRPYGGMSCYFQQNIAFVAFKTAQQMQSVCQLRLYMDDNRLLIGRPRVLRSSESASSPTNSTSTLLPKAISIQP